MDVNTLQAELARLKAENAALIARTEKPITFKVSEKGALSVYGLGRFPVTLYKSQWVRLMNVAERIQTFIRDNESRLAVREGTPVAAGQQTHGE